MRQKKHVVTSMLSSATIPAVTSEMHASRLRCVASLKARLYANIHMHMHISVKTKYFPGSLSFNDYDSCSISVSFIQ